MTIRPLSVFHPCASVAFTFLLQPDLHQTTVSQLCSLAQIRKVASCLYSGVSFVTEPSRVTVIEEAPSGISAVVILPPGQRTQIASAFWANPNT